MSSYVDVTNENLALHAKIEESERIIQSQSARIKQLDKICDDIEKERSLLEKRHQREDEAETASLKANVKKLLEANDLYKRQNSNLENDLIALENSNKKYA